MSTLPLTQTASRHSRAAEAQDAASIQRDRIRALVDTAPPLGPSQKAIIRRAFQGAGR